MAVFKKQGVYWLDYYVNGHRKRERIGPDKRLAETVLRKRKVEIAEGRFLEKQQPVTTTFDELAEVYLKWIRPNDAGRHPGSQALMAQPRPVCHWQASRLLRREAPHRHHTRLGRTIS